MGPFFSYEGVGTGGRAVVQIIISIGQVTPTTTTTTIHHNTRQDKQEEEGGDEVK